MLCKKSKTLFTIFTNITLLKSTATKTVIIAYYDKNRQKLQKTLLKLTKKDVKAITIWIVPVFL